MARLDQERQKELEPERIEFAVEKLAELNISAVRIDDHELQFQWKGKTIRLWPYSGFYSGKGIKPGRGIHNLLAQLKK